VIDLVAIIKEFTQADHPLSYQWGLTENPEASARIASMTSITWIDRDILFFWRRVRGRREEEGGKGARKK